jgi:cbb3-type cytochrome c oxidase subunit III
MKQFLVLLLILLVSSPTEAADPVAGKNKASTCGACHGADGNSASDLWPNLAGQHASYLEKQTKEIRDGKRSVPEMMGFVANLSDKDIADIAAYFAGQEQKPNVANPESVELGSTIYSAGAEGVMACSACHGPNGAGLEAAGFPRISGQKVAYSISQLKKFKSGERTNGNNSMMNDIAAAMSEEQIIAVANYLAGLH